MYEKVFRLEESSDLAFSFACEACRTNMTTLKQCAKRALYSASTFACKFRVVIFVLRAQCSENMFCLSSERKDGRVSPSFFMIRSF